ncbi:uncharacterized protein JN550_011515 [Neoarthrinium moseri]|uniref:uncharacterized protein n=1 Tax=Neoarthrinium moseri TaxID=1658444 RepID=UPI001FDE48CE|nr:uncharacterized protein JN550_011515 [Neoarthrinium moseri]KAI1860363.1 hypothetical protein JN550_011515 [Neoarthrinium moseri]
MALKRALLIAAAACSPFLPVVHSQNATVPEIVDGTIRIYGNDAYKIPYRRLMPTDAARARYPGFKQETLTLKNGTIRREGAKALTSDIVFERDVALTLRDGVTIYADVYRPVGDQQVPAIIAYSPYGKQVGGQNLDDSAGRAGVPLANVSDLQKFEAADPAYWVPQGYAIVNPDTRGAYASQGNITYWGRQLAEDGYDLVEWIATQPWSSGKVAMSGNSWLGVSQWFTAAEHPPHLTAIAPWEALADLYRHVTNRGGIPAPAFQESIITSLAGNGFVEDSPRLIVGEGLINQYWEDKIARLEEITVPAYIVASYQNVLHTHGSFDGFRRIQSESKWLRVHNSFEWPDYYVPEHVEDLRRFFDHFLKGLDNGWDKTERIRLAILDPGHEDELNRPVGTWPVDGTTPTRFYPQADGALSTTAFKNKTVASYEVGGNSSSLTFKYTVPHGELLEINGYSKVRFWVEANGSNDMELQFLLEKRAANGSAFAGFGATASNPTVSSTEYIRVSHRALDTQRSTNFEPYLTHDREELLSAGQIVPIEVGLWPIAIRFHPGESFVLTISPVQPLTTALDAGSGVAAITIPAAGGTYEPGSNVPMITLGGVKSNPAFVDEQRVATPVGRNNGTHIFHFGGCYDSHLLLPLNITSIA